MFLFLAALSWRKGADPLIDFGAQLYIPWQLASGKLLFRDIAYLPGGPFSQLFNATIFQWFGASLTTLMLTNLSIFALLLIVVFRFFEKISDAMCASAVCLVILLVFGFAELAPNGNYNYVMPYSHDAYHSIVLSILAISFLSCWLLHNNRAALVGSGICVGLVFLTKPDIFLAVAITAGVAFAMYWRQHKDTTEKVKSLAWFVLALIIPPAIAFFYFQQFQPAKEALRAAAWAWIPLLTTDAANNNYYAWCLGLDHPIKNTAFAFLQFVGFCSAVALCTWIARSGPRNVRQYVLCGTILTMQMVGLWLTDWKEGGRLLLFIAPAIAGFLTWQWWKTQETSSRLIPAILWSVFAVMALAKMGFHSRIWHYGAFLGMPAAVLAIYFLFGFLPGYLSRWNIRPMVLRGIFGILLLTVSTKIWLTSNEKLSIKTLSMGQGSDKFHFYQENHDPTGLTIAEASQWIEKNTPHNATLAVLPQGVLINYLTRRTNPTPYGTYTPPEVQAFGQENILNAYKSSPPDYIAITHFPYTDGFEYDVGRFGESSQYGLETMQWIQQHYNPIKIIRYRKRGFKIDILKLKSTD